MQGVRDLRPRLTVADGAVTSRAIERVSIELTTRCEKGCSFCYNGSSNAGGTDWTLHDLIDLCVDCHANGTRAISFGGGEPLQFEPLFDLLTATRGIGLFRSMTTNGLRLKDAAIERLAEAAIDKVHVSIHFPHLRVEVDRAIDGVRRIDAAGIKGGVNLLVRASQIDAAIDAAKRLRDAGIGNDRIVYLPMRGRDTPSADDVGRVAGGARFQSMTCLMACGKSERFCSIDASRRVAWCSYTQSRRRLLSPTHAALREALDGLGLTFCGDSDATERLSRSSQHGQHVVRRR